MPAAWVAAAAAVVGSVASSDASRKASNTQADAANAANATQANAAAQARADNLPWMNRGNQAGDRLQYLLGLDNGSGGASGGSGAPVNFTADQLRQQLIGQYTSNINGIDLNGYQDAYNHSIGGMEGSTMPTLADFQRPAVVDEYALNNEINSRLQQQQQAETLRQQAASAKTNDPAYGSLLRRFSSADMANDPVYQSGLQFGLDQGVQGINRQAASRGGLDSGATLKALTRFANDYGSTKANESRNRFTDDQSREFNMLSGVSGTGQVANSQIASTGMNAANNISNNQVGVGNARASGYLSAANGINNGISTGYNMYQGNQLLSRLPVQNSGSANTSSTPTNYYYNQGGYPTDSGGQMQFD